VVRHLFSGHPALSLPLGEINHRPVALQLVANKNKEFDLLNYAEYLLEKLK
jgi:Asp-tRNAAsn/Glu-tRNAGln amidotransferase A subunit and related amidases